MPPTTPARSIYELHLIDPTTGERHNALALSVITELLGGLSQGTFGGGGWSAKLTLEVVDRRTDTVVLTMRERDVSARRLAQMITTDLDRLNAEKFAEEWGIEGTRQSGG